MQLTIIPNEQTPAIPDMEGQWTVDPYNVKIMYEFVQFVTSNPRALGMAANQIAADGERIMLPFFMMQRKNGRWDLVIQPKITSHQGEIKDEVELCLTWEGKKVLAKRWETVTVEWHRLDGDGATKVVEELTGLEAQIFQHEYDHLKGVPEVIVDWDYQTIKSSGAKVGRNDPCLCGSGKKNKKCCGG